MYYIIYHIPYMIYHISYVICYMFYTVHCPLYVYAYIYILHIVLYPSIMFSLRLDEGAIRRFQPAQAVPVGGAEACTARATL